MKIAGGWSSKNTCWAALVPTWPDVLAAETVNTSGDVPSDGPAGRGKLNAYVLPPCDAPGCAQAPVSPCTRRQVLAASTPDWPAMLAEMASGPPAVSKKARDRKSTRLNSSHSSISYAVFCLKKKT